MGFPILVRRYLYIELGPRPQCVNGYSGNCCSDIGSGEVVLVEAVGYNFEGYHLFT